LLELQGVLPPTQYFVHFLPPVPALAGQRLRTPEFGGKLTIDGLYKAELIHRRAPWKTKEAVELATLEWVHWFNHHRLLEPIGYIPPAEAEANYYRTLARQDTEAVV
jgi:transposase InsO family protein